MHHTCQRYMHCFQMVHYLFIFRHITHPCLSPTLLYFEVNSLLDTVNVDPVFVGLQVLGKILGPEREEVKMDWRK